MQMRHGILEGAILTTLWKMEKENKYANTVKDVFEFINKSSSEMRAYTTIKTVMDRLASKKILIREKRNKKFLYRTSYSSCEMIKLGLRELSAKYCCGDLNMVQYVVNLMQNEKRAQA